METKRVILVQAHGRPSTKGVFSSMKSQNVTMLHKRTLPNKKYYRQYIKGRLGFTKLMTFSPGMNDVIIRWGNRIHLEGAEHITYNNIKAQEQAGNKKKAREIMLAAGVRCPRLITPQNYKNNETVIARPVVHSKGKNFVVLKSREQFVNHYNSHPGWYYSEFINKDTEYRVHVALGKVLAVLEKPRPADGGIAWNRAQNHAAFNLVEWKNVKKDICLQALLAAEALSCDISGIDVIFKDDQAYVLEANMAPTLASSPHVTEKYAQAFDFIFRNTKTKKLKWWDFKKWEKRESFFWKDFQLAANLQSNDINEINQ